MHIGDLPLQYGNWVLVQTTLLYLQGLSDLRGHTAVGTILHVSLQFHASKQVNIHSAAVYLPQKSSMVLPAEMMIFRNEDLRGVTRHIKAAIWLENSSDSSNTFPFRRFWRCIRDLQWIVSLTQQQSEVARCLSCVRLTLHTPEGWLTSNPCFNFDFLKSSCFHTFVFLPCSLGSTYVS